MKEEKKIEGTGTKGVKNLHPRVPVVVYLGP